MQTLHIPPYKRFVPVHLAHASKGGNVTNSIQDTVCLELGMYSRTASSYEDLICQNLFQTQQSIELKDSPTNFFRMLLCHFLHTLYRSVPQSPSKLLPLRSSPQHLAYAVPIQ